MHEESVQQIIFRAEVNESGETFEDVRSDWIETFFVFFYFCSITTNSKWEQKGIWEVYLCNSSFQLFLIYASNRRKNVRLG